MIARCGRGRPARILRPHNLLVRPTGSGGDRLWLTDEGEPLTYWGAQAIFRRAKRKSGVARLHAHLLRHTFAQGALKKGAPRAEVQDMLGHRTDAMTRRYTGTAREQAAARNMARYGAL